LVALCKRPLVPVPTSPTQNTEQASDPGSDSLTEVYAVGCVPYNGECPHRPRIFLEGAVAKALACLHDLSE
jgi:hypothetical protein